MRALEVLLSGLCLLATFATSEGQAPAGCNANISSIFYNLCDVQGAWGIVLEAIASAGVVASFLLIIILLATTPFVQDSRKKSLIPTQVLFLVATLGLFGIVFAFIVKPTFATCGSRRFLFGVLFGICFSCLWAHAILLNFLVRKNRGPRGLWIFAIAVGLAMVEVIINTEWLIITLVRSSPTVTCSGTMDFTMALIYVMFLILVTFLTAWPAVCGKYRHWVKHSVFIILTISMSIAIWIVWIVMYVYGNQQVIRTSAWDDPTLSIALVSNAWTFLFLYIIPELAQITKPGPQEAFEEDVYQTHGVGYETILKEQQKSQNSFVENKAFSMDEPTAANKPVSPYGGFNPARNSVYQPTEMALMPKRQVEAPYDIIIPRATANSQVNSNNSTIRADDAYSAQDPSAFNGTRW